MFEYVVAPLLHYLTVHPCFFCTAHTIASGVLESSNFSMLSPRVPLNTTNKAVSFDPLLYLELKKYVEN